MLKFSTMTNSESKKEQKEIEKIVVFCHGCSYYCCCCCFLLLLFWVVVKLSFSFHSNVWSSLIFHYPLVYRAHQVFCFGYETFFFFFVEFQYLFRCCCFFTFHFCLWLDSHVVICLQMFIYLSGAFDGLPIQY